MRFGIKTLDEYDLKGKTVLCRVDMNQPVDKATNTLKSINRIQACVPTIKEMVDKGAKVVLMAHQGSDIEYKKLLYHGTSCKGFDRTFRSAGQIY